MSLYRSGVAEQNKEYKLLLNRKILHGVASAIALAIVMLILLPAPADAAWWRRGREELRDRGSAAGKVIAATRRSDSLRADLLVYSNLVEARVSCVTVDDLERVENKIELGTSLYVLGTGEMTDDGCSIARLWRPIGKSPKADAIVGIRHDIAMRLYGIEFPERIGRFIGDGELQLRHSELQRLANFTPLLYKAAKVLDIDMPEVNGIDSEELRELEDENGELRRKLADMRHAEPVAAEWTREQLRGEQCLEKMKGIVAEIRPLEFALEHVAAGGRGHHPGLEESVMNVLALARTFKDPS